MEVIRSRAATLRRTRASKGICCRPTGVHLRDRPGCRDDSGERELEWEPGADARPRSCRCRKEWWKGGLVVGGGVGATREGGGERDVGNRESGPHWVDASTVGDR